MALGGSASGFEIQNQGVTAKPGMGAKVNGGGAQQARVHDMKKSEMNLNEFFLGTRDSDAIETQDTRVGTAAVDEDDEHGGQVELIDDPDWSAENKTFGQTDGETGNVTVQIAGRHPMDILRTIAHELSHVHNGHTDGADGSDDENEANAQAGAMMRQLGKESPELFLGGHDDMGEIDEMHIQKMKDKVAHMKTHVDSMSNKVSSSRKQDRHVKHGHASGESKPPNKVESLMEMFLHEAAGDDKEYREHGKSMKRVGLDAKVSHKLSAAIAADHRKEDPNYYRKEMDEMKVSLKEFFQHEGIYPSSRDPDGGKRDKEHRLTHPGEFDTHEPEGKYDQMDRDAQDADLKKKPFQVSYDETGRGMGDEKFVMGFDSQQEASQYIDQQLAKGIGSDEQWLIDDNSAGDLDEAGGYDAMDDEKTRHEVHPDQDDFLMQVLLQFSDPEQIEGIQLTDGEEEILNRFRDSGDVEGAAEAFRTEMKWVDDRTGGDDEDYSKYDNWDEGEKSNPFDTDGGPTPDRHDGGAALARDKKIGMAEVFRGDPDDDGGNRKERQQDDKDHHDFKKSKWNKDDEQAGLADWEKRKK